MSNKKDSLGDRLKAYESRTELQMLPMIPVLVRLDGRAFHTYTKGLDRPFDERFHDCMVFAMKSLVEESGAVCGYTQSDEITLLLHSTEPKSQIWFGGRHSKIVSQSAAGATLAFSRYTETHLPEKRDHFPTFDSRCWQVPNTMEVVNSFLWRERDCTRNSISMAAHAHFSPKQLHKKSSAMKQDMLMEAGTNWNDYPAAFKRGTYCRREEMYRKFTSDELEALPEKHNARQNPELVVERSEVRAAPLSLPLSKTHNKSSVIFEGAMPIPITEEV